MGVIMEKNYDRNIITYSKIFTFHRSSFSNNRAISLEVLWTNLETNKDVSNEWKAFQPESRCQ